MTFSDWDGPVVWRVTKDDKNHMQRDSCIEHAILVMLERKLNPYTAHVWGIEDAETEGEFFHALEGLDDYLKLAWPEVEPCSKD